MLAFLKQRCRGGGDTPHNVDVVSGCPSAPRVMNDMDYNCTVNLSFIIYPEPANP
ncbi:hypothetical protein J6590_061027 [Homalodisca vitripennis]|nr:hypothetical protein J6590_061027 [Homalodisca vitripennis]